MVGGNRSVIPRTSERRSERQRLLSFSLRTFEQSSPTPCANQRFISLTTFGRFLLPNCPTKFFSVAYTKSFCCQNAAKALR